MSLRLLTQPPPPTEVEPGGAPPFGPGSAREPRRVPEGSSAEATLRRSVRASVKTLEALLCEPGRAAPPADDAGPSWTPRFIALHLIRHGVVLDDGSPLTGERFRTVLAEEMDRVRLEVGEERFECGRFEDARLLFERMSTPPEFAESTTLPARDRIEAGTEERA